MCPRISLKELTFQTDIVSLGELHKQEFKVWEPDKMEDLEVLLKIYAFFVPQSDPTREPILQVASFEVDESIAIAPKPSDYYVVDLSSNSNAPNVNLSYQRGGRPERGYLDDLLIPSRTELAMSSLYWSGTASSPVSPAFTTTNSDIHFLQSGKIFASDVIVDKSLSTAPGVKVEIHGYNIKVSPNTEISPDIRLIPMDVEVYSHFATAEQIQSICSSSEYLERTKPLGRIKEVTDSLSNSLLEKVEAKLAPNPTSDEAVLWYELTESAEVQVTLIDALGVERPVLLTEQAAGIQELRLDVSTYPSGLYYLDLQVDGKRATLPLLIQR